MSQSSLKTKILSRYLIEHNSDVAAVNNDGELPIDIAETEAMEELLERETQLRGITICKTFPSYNLTTVIIQQVLIVKQLECKKKDKCLPTLVGGYIRVMSMLVQGGGELNVQDIDGWTPLHAAAHWGQREACQLLCENMADMEVRNYVVRSKALNPKASRCLIPTLLTLGPDVFRRCRSRHYPVTGRM